MRIKCKYENYFRALLIIPNFRKGFERWEKEKRKSVFWKEKSPCLMSIHVKRLSRFFFYEKEKVGPKGWGILSYFAGNINMRFQNIQNGCLCFHKTLLKYETEGFIKVMISFH